MNRKGADSAKGRIGPFEFAEPAGGHRLTEDTVGLVEFASPFLPEDTVIDLGAGSGAIPLLILSKTKVKKIVAIEADELSAAAAGENSRRNGGLFEVVHADWRTLREKFDAGSFSMVISNPPYVKQGHGRAGADGRRTRARSESLGTLADLLDITAYLLSPDGRACFVFPIVRKEEFLRELSRVSLSVRRVVDGSAPTGRKPKVFFAETAHRSNGG